MRPEREAERSRPTRRYVPSLLIRLKLKKLAVVSPFLHSFVIAMSLVSAVFVVFSISSDNGENDLVEALCYKSEGRGFETR
jgi:hypothetical protein